MATVHYFAFGSNMLANRLLARCPEARPLGAAFRDGYDFSFHKQGRDGSGKGMITPSDAVGARAYGVVFAFEESEIPELDRIEGVGQGYLREDRFEVTMTLSSETLAAFTYMVQPQFIDRDLVPYDWYHGLVLAGARQWALPQTYAQVIAGTASKPDPDPERPGHIEARQLLDLHVRGGGPISARS